MYSEKLMNYLYSYDMPHKQKEEDANNKKPSNKSGIINLGTLKKLRNAYASVPVEFNHE